MKHDPDKMMNDFIEHLHVYRYPQTVVCDTVNAALTDLNEWRRREILPKDGYEKRGRIIYTGAMLLRAGFLAELAPIIGPSQASRFADVFLMTSDFDPSTIKDKVAIFDLAPADAAITEWLGKEDAIGAKDYPAFHLVDQTKTFASIDHAKIVFPVGRLIPMWMVGAELRLESKFEG